MKDHNMAWLMLGGLLLGAPLLVGVMNADWGAYRLVREMTESILVQYFHMLTHVIPIAVAYFAARPLHRRGYAWPAWGLGVLVFVALYMCFSAGFSSLGGGLGRRYDGVFDSGHDGL